MHAGTATKPYMLRDPRAQVDPTEGGIKPRNPYLTPGQYVALKKMLDGARLFD